MPYQAVATTATTLFERQPHEIFGQSILHLRGGGDDDGDDDDDDIDDGYPGDEDDDDDDDDDWDEDIA